MTNQLKLEGTADEIGAECFIKILMPVVREASKQFDTKQLAELYAGFAGAMIGSMIADFGPDNALTLINQVVRNSNVWALGQEVH